MKNKTLLSASLALMMALPMQAQQLKEYAGNAELRIPECKITAPPKSLHLDKFYKKYVDVNGIPICNVMASARLMYSGCASYPLCYDEYVKTRGVGSDEKAWNSCSYYG